MLTQIYLYQLVVDPHVVVVAVVVVVVVVVFLYSCVVGVRTVLCCVVPNVVRPTGLVLSVKDAEAAFDEIDRNDGGQILFDEFCRWVVTSKIPVD